jgi:hypothetical protein
LSSKLLPSIPKAAKQSRPKDSIHITSEVKVEMLNSDHDSYIDDTLVPHGKPQIQNKMRKQICGAKASRCATSLVTLSTRNQP